MEQECSNRKQKNKTVVISSEVLFWNIYSCSLNQSLKEDVSILKSYHVAKTKYGRLG